MKCIIKSQAPNFFKLLPEYYNRVTGKTLKYIYADLPDDERRIPMGIAVCSFDTFLSFIAVQASSIKEDIGDFSIRITTKDTEETKTDDDFTIGELKRAWTDRPEVAKTLDSIANTLGRRLRKEQISEQNNADAEISKIYADLSEKKQKDDYELLKEYSAKSNELFLRAMVREKKPFHMIMPEEHKEIEIVSDYFILKQGADFVEAAKEVCENLHDGGSCDSYNALKTTVSQNEGMIEFIRSTREGSYFIAFRSFGEFLKKFKEFLELKEEGYLLPLALKSSTEHIEEI